MVETPLRGREPGGQPGQGTVLAAVTDRSSRLRAGQWVEVRAKAEILGTLDERGRLDGLPFMPQMLGYCGQRFKVYKRAHKTCDTVSGVYRGRHLPDGVHLDLRCNGEAYGGCQAGCLLFWKEAWLQPVAGPIPSEDDGQVRCKPAPLPSAPVQSTPVQSAGGCTEAAVHRHTVKSVPPEETRYACQATDLLLFTSPLSGWDARQYVEDYHSRNVSAARIMRGLIYATYVTYTRAAKPRLGAPARWLYDSVQSFWGGMPFPRRMGTIPAGAPTPVTNLDLQAGDLVRVKSYQAILATLNDKGANRNMNYDAELVPYSGRIFRVRARVEHFIEESTGKMKTMKTPAVILEGVYCQSRYSDHRMFCPRSIYSWWREVWLERVDAATEQGTAANAEQAAGPVSPSARPDASPEPSRSPMA